MFPVFRDGNWPTEAREWVTCRILYMLQDLNQHLRTANLGSRTGQRGGEVLNDRVVVDIIPYLSSHEETIVF